MTICLRFPVWGHHFAPFDNGALEHVKPDSRLLWRPFIFVPFNAVPEINWAARLVLNGKAPLPASGTFGSSMDRSPQN